MAHPAPKFTPGPWRIEKCQCGSPHCDRHGTSNGMFYQGSGYSSVDVALVAAAPELYDWIATIENDDGRIPDWLWQQREGLLAKARGEQ